MISKFNSIFSITHKNYSPFSIIFLFLFYSFWFFFLETPLFASVYIYNGEGTSGVSELTYLIEEAYPQELVKQIGPEEILKSSQWTQDATLFVMPGGQGDRFYLRDLGEKGMAAIRDYVKLQGGKYLGICAGAYFAGSHVSFHKGNFHMEADRGLGLFSGTVKGPTYMVGQENVISYVNLDKGLNFFYKDGGYFLNLNSNSDKVLASYGRENTPIQYNIYGNFEGQSGDWMEAEESELPALILVKSGKGMALLSGVHPEYRAAFVDDRKAHEWFIETLRGLFLKH